jgi:hypothetical protein
MMQEASLGALGIWEWLAALDIRAWLAALDIHVWLAALAVGLALGLLGSGGSILTVPLLIYLVGQPERVAIASSLAIVGVISALGALPYAWRKQVSWRNVAFFGIPGMFGTYAGAWLSAFVTAQLQLLLFSVVMLLAATLMLRPQREKVAGTRRELWRIGVDGAAVGVLTGLVGVGGGFLIIPALVLLGALPMHIAVGTSLVVIALKSASGFVKYLDVLLRQGLAIEWSVITLFAAVGTIGSLLGSMASGFISQSTLRRVFGFCLIAVAAFMLWNNLGNAHELKR